MDSLQFLLDRFFFSLECTYIHIYSLEDIHGERERVVFSSFMHPINVHETPAVSQVQCGLQQRAQELPTLLELVLRERRVLWMGSLCLLETSLGWMPSPQCGGNWRWSLWEVVGLGWGGESGVSVLGLAPLAGMKVPDLGCPCPRGHDEKLTVYKAGRGLPPNPTVGAPCPSAPGGLGRETQSGVCSAAQAD